MYKQIIKKQLYFTVLSNEKDRIKLLEEAEFYNQEEGLASTTKHWQQRDVWAET